MARVIKPEGYVLVIRAADTHLWSVREALFGEVRAHQPDKFLEELSPHFTLQQQHDLRFDLQLPQQALKQLLAMTPYVWKAHPERRLALENHNDFQTTAAFSLMLLRKKLY
jgi:23S rRNA (guanine745-N1)-methyltransferase